MSTSYLASAGLIRHPLSESHDEDGVRTVASGPDRPDSILLGESLSIRRLRSQMQPIAPFYRTALIRGEIGCGKRDVGRAIHALPAGADGPFIVVNATSLAEAAWIARPT